MNLKDTAQKITLPRTRDHLLYWPIVIVGAAADLWTKHAVFQWLETRPYNEVTLIPNILTFVMRQNDGAAFSMFSGQRWPLAAVSIAALFFVMGLFLLAGIRHRLTLVALAMFTAGIIGNLYDRLFNHGFVRDFIDVVYYPGKHWPAFNIADSLLCIAVGLLLISSFTSPASQTPENQHKSPPQGPTPGQSHHSDGHQSQ